MNINQKTEQHQHNQKKIYILVQIMVTMPLTSIIYYSILCFCQSELTGIFYIPYFYFLLFWPQDMACGILVPWPGTELLTHSSKSSEF